MTIQPESSKVLIIGAGAFGVSTAYHLLKRGFSDVTVVERSETVPAPDAASNDYNRIVRTSYSDRFYSELTKKAIGLWKDGEVYGDSYHESGVVILTDDANPDSDAARYSGLAYENDQAIGARLHTLDSEVDSTTASSSRISTQLFAPKTNVNPAIYAKGTRNYVNLDGGWANAQKGVEMLSQEVVRLGGRLVVGKRAKNLIRNEHGKTIGVRCEDAVSGDTDILEGDVVVLALGAWTNSTFPELNLTGSCLATGQFVAMIQLTEEETLKYSGVPVVLDLATGFYVFPPTREGIFKVALHGRGRTVTNAAGISAPRTIVSDGKEGLRIPKSVLPEFRSFLRRVYPDLADRPFLRSRLCWYNDTPDENFIIGKCPGDDGLVVASGDSGHAYKLLPVLGEIVADAVMDQLCPALARRFAVGRGTPPEGAHSRPTGGSSEELDITNLCTEDDLTLD
ncbi:FAD dependent oxidoreductase [Pterulicium gracile]|uniref:FAD dependent oxidoreductase n=1 Tax=Pterulicium gracile TaxID=1884261 RepID=A0A5C3R378_9AGAR|nr:FAD dependent oxidoreductase [Pterula gracilis]